MKEKEKVFSKEVLSIIKECSSCKAIKRGDEFYSHKSTKDGLTKKCGECIQKNRDSNYRGIEYKQKYIMPPIDPKIQTEKQMLGNDYQLFLDNDRKFREETGLY